jgi:hypothetical protein
VSLRGVETAKSSFRIIEPSNPMTPSQTVVVKLGRMNML